MKRGRGLKRNGYPQSQNIYCQNTSRKLETLFFFNYKIKYVIFLDDGERKGLFEFWDNVGLG